MSDTTGPIILVVDDDPALLRVLPDMLHLRLAGLTIETADSATAALERIIACDYDAIVTDIKMPGMDGLALLERVHALRPDTPTLLITGHGEHDLAVQALRGGAFDFIQKPIDRDYFVASLSRAIRMRRMTRELDERRQTLEARAAQLENLVEEQTRDLREANRLKDVFLATLAHELRNPLAPIRNAVEVMRLRGSEDPSLTGARDIIERQVELLGRLVDDLLDLNSISRGKLALRKRPVDVAACIDHALELVRGFVAARGHEVDVRLDDGQLLVEADAVRIEQIIANLVHNAAKYSERGGLITIQAGRHGDGVLLTVRDTGMGIAPEMLSRIFEPFTQGEQSIDRPHGGLGIGLTLVRKLAEMHGGRVEARSAGVGKGSEMVVWLPAATAVPSSLQPERRGADAIPAEPRCILLVEDNADNRESLKVLLELKGHRVDAAADGPEGVAKALAFRYDVALVDIGLPGMTGYEVAERLRAETPSTMLVALTGYGSSADRERASRAGFDAHLLKPVDFAALAHVLEQPRDASPAASTNGDQGDPATPALKKDALPT